MKTDITVVLDRSGSMESIAGDVIGGLNTFIRAQAQVEGEACFTLVQFDDRRDRGMIDLLDDHVDVMTLAQLSRQRLQLLQPPCHEDQRPALSRVLPGEFLAEAARRARDEYPRIGCRCHAVHLDDPMAIGSLRERLPLAIVERSL